MCRKSPLAILSDGRIEKKLPGGPRAGCHSCLLILPFVRVFVTLIRSYVEVSDQAVPPEDKGTYVKRDLLETLER